MPSIMCDKKVLHTRGFEMKGMTIKYLTCFVCYFAFMIAFAGTSATGAKDSAFASDDIKPGAWRTGLYFPMLEGKRIAVAGNHTSRIGDTHLVDTMLAEGLELVKVFSPEHGFRGEAAAGEAVESEVDEVTGLPVISLYGTNRRPTPRQLRDVDIIVFDIQDVGTRFYTYISTMTYLMEEAAEQDIPFLILDRPNPNGHYVDGPVLEPAYTSFVGLHSVPIVHGMTVGEYAYMVYGEGWMGEDVRMDLRVVPVEDYTHESRYHLPEAPSPNLPNMHAVYLYPSLCLFEGTSLSVGRGTDKPFQIFGHPDLPAEYYPYRFTPESVPAAPDPPAKGQSCNGLYPGDTPLPKLEKKDRLNLSWLITSYRHYQGETFFNDFFDKLAGNAALRNQIQNGWSADEIRESWQEELKQFKAIRSQYLLYPDFEE